MNRKSDKLQKLLFVAFLVLPVIIFPIGALQLHVVIMTVAVLLFFINYHICFSSLAEKFLITAKHSLLAQLKADSEEEEEDMDETWDLKEIFPRVFVLSFGNHYDLGMRFLRYQEYYESPCPDFKGTVFTLLDYMDWYAKANGGVFSYPDDWAGFNVPGWVFKEVLESGKIEDWNQYDEFMLSIINEIKVKLPPDDSDRFYLIGTRKGDEETVEHELAHAFYYIFPEYKREVNALIAKLQNERPELVRLVYECLEDAGYDQTVHDDELQAYFATGLMSEMIVKIEKKKMAYKDFSHEFRFIFDKWNKKSAS